MYDLTMFDSRRLKIASWWGCHIPVVLAIGVVLTAGLAYLRLPATIPAFGTLVLWGYLSLFGSTFMPGNAFGFKNGADKFFVKHGTDYVFMREQYQSMKQSAFVRREQFVWSVTIGDQELPIMFTDKGGCIAWMQLDRQFPHVVVDSLADNHPFHRQFAKASLPPERIRLEGNFPDYFHVYQEHGQQVMTLQILSPDRMMYLVESLRDVNLEIQDRYLRLYAANAQKSSADFQAFLDTLASFQKGLKVARINAIE